MSGAVSHELEFIRRHPQLFHVSEAGAWPVIRRLGLLSATALLDRFEVTAESRRQVEAAPRRDAVRLWHPAHGEAWIRDNKPLRPEILATCLEGISETEWMRLLNTRVFFWVDHDRATTLIHARAHRQRAHDVLVIDTRSVLVRHRDRVELAAINTGAALFPGAPPRGRATFAPLSRYKPAQRVVELTVRNSVPDIEAVTLRVERWQAGKRPVRVWARCRRP